MANQLINYLESFASIEIKDQLLITDLLETRQYKEGDYLFYPNNICRELFLFVKEFQKLLFSKKMEIL